MSPGAFPGNAHPGPALHLALCWALGQEHRGVSWKDGCVFAALEEDPGSVSVTHADCGSLLPATADLAPSSSSSMSAVCTHKIKGTMAVIPSGAHPVARALEVPRNSSKSTVPLTQRPGIRHHRFALFVPFPTSLEAEIACGSLAPDVEPHQGLIGKELKVSGSVLEVHWTSEDSRLLRISIMNFLDQLSLVVNTVQVFGPPFSC
eukprot:XP_017444412.1 PREDICTED: putative uncharacterized protein C19orf81 homolog isoform X4 [Rattus norvegicus]